MKTIIVASQNQMACDTVRSCFRAEYRVEVASNKESCLAFFKKKRCEFLLIDVEILRNGSEPGNGSNIYKDALQPFWQIFPTTEIIVMSSQENIREAVMVVKAGAGNYITYPIHIDELRHVVDSSYKTLLMRSELDYLRAKLWNGDPPEMFMTNSPGMKKIFERVLTLAPTNTTVLLTGETGTGKGLLAKLIHRHSTRANAQFITIHCGAIPDTLLESELFGHEKGAFTGADRRKLGKFEIAQKGTLFLDEIGTMTPSAQIKLLQVLQEKTFQRVGGEVALESDVRIIVATNADLRLMSEQGLFRKDLYYRLNVFPIEVPALRERVEDIPHLAELFLRKLNKLNSKEIRYIDPRVAEAFKRYSWPGNIRELENLIERAYLLEKSSVLMPESFPGELFAFHPSKPNILPDVSCSLAEMKRQITGSYLRNLLSFHKGRIQRSATAAGITSRQMHKLMKQHGIKKEDYKSPPC